ncbi:hypothetical protein IE077_001520 [Cardiosporidium cionae]|uniref:Uncharacterized protein n=1 Tax=Cardiosporidium cionae TaxID=476202 RepID=A0ABQ7J585_9APIC|nr:hypothetical protein IE077_001520 [Cardiosporidium cionae]|eukprot:KAF8819169.1 hypothetical protein IE077_001520 [Cardiosporidium cionae]
MGLASFVLSTRLKCQLLLPIKYSHRSILRRNIVTAHFPLLQVKSSLPLYSFLQFPAQRNDLSACTIKPGHERKMTEAFVPRFGFTNGHNIFSAISKHYPVSRENDVFECGKFNFGPCLRSLDIFSYVEEPHASLLLFSGATDESKFVERLCHSYPDLTHCNAHPISITMRPNEAQHFLHPSIGKTGALQDNYSILLEMIFFSSREYPLLCNKSRNDGKQLWIGTPHKGKWRHKHTIVRRNDMKRNVYALQGVDILKMKYLKWGEVQ